jgi:signal peptide peptidase SppA
MAHGALRIKEKLCNTPHLISPTSFDTIVSYLESRDNVLADSGESVDEASYSYSENGVGFIEINGALTYKPTGMEMLCGGTSYVSILEAMDELIEEHCHTVVLSIDSGGGEAYSMVQTAMQLRQLADANEIKLLAYVDGMAASAAYGLACAAHEIIVNPDAEVGSIGVVVRLMNDSKRLEQEGLERSFVYAGENKIPYAADGSFRKEFIDDIQAKVDAMYTQFTEYVAEYRNMPVESVVATQASVYMAQDAVSNGLADSVQTREQFFNYLADISEEQKKYGGTMIPKLFSMSTKQKEKAEMADIAALQAQMETIVASNSELSAKVASYEASIAEMGAKFEAVVKERDEAQAALAAHAAAEQAKAQAAEEARLNARKEKLSAAVGDEKAVEMFEALKALPDAAFDSVVASMSAAVDQKNAQMDEIGFTVEQQEVVQEDRTAAILKQRYQKEGK